MRWPFGGKKLIMLVNSIKVKFYPPSSYQFVIGGGGGGDAARRPFEGDLGGIRLWLLPPRRPSRHFQMVYMNMQICRARQKLLLVIFTLQGAFNIQMRKSCHVKQRFFFAGTPLCF